MYSPMHNEIICIIKIRANTLQLVQLMKSFRKIESFGEKRGQNSFTPCSVWRHGCHHCPWIERTFASQHAFSAYRANKTKLLLKVPALTAFSYFNIRIAVNLQPRWNEHFWSSIQHKSHTKNICLRSEHMCHILLSRENNRRSIKTRGKREHGGASPVWAAAGSYLNQLMCTRVPEPTTTNQVPPLHSQIKYLFSFSSSLSFKSFTPSFVLRTQGVNSIRRPRRDEWNGIKQ